jgi:HAD superfamily hydrolase (TIGR01484 family)
VRYHAFAVDYDGTLARHSEVEATTLDALKRLKESGRKLILVTGRELPDLFNIFKGLPEPVRPRLQETHIGLLDRRSKAPPKRFN